ISSFIYGPAMGVLPVIYGKYFGLDLAVIGTVLMVARLFDAVTDPVIGYLSDHTKTRIGQRKPWMIAGYGLTLFAIYALFVPPENVSATYFTISFLLFYLFMTMAEIPYTAWQAELSYDYKQRTRIVTYRTVSNVLGGAVFAAIPLLPVFATTEFTPEVMHVVAMGVIVLLPLATIMTVCFVPKGKQVSVKESTSVSDLFSAVLRNKPFFHLMVCYALYALAGGIYFVAGFIYFDTYLLNGDKYAYIMLAGMLSNVAVMPLWLKAMNRFGRHRTWSVGSFIGVLLFPLLLLFEPGTQALPVLILLWMCLVAAFGVGMTAPMAMLGDIIDYDTLKTGANRPAQYYAFFALTTKGAYAMGSGIGFFILKFYNYDMKLTVHDTASIFGLKLVLVWVPVALFLITAILIWFFPIDERRQQIIKRRIESLAMRAQRTKENEKMNIIEEM
ncbi:MAG: MFS transporter, partial [Desulfobacterales bacterium]|nr:MFS transporter [Desulfobacterales bacterium]